MKKIMFDDKRGLTQAVLTGRKTMTRRIIPEDETKGGLVPVSYWNGKWCGSHGRPLKRQPYKRGEVLAIAQSYKDAGVSFIYPPDPQWGCTSDMAGYNNKMFVRADLMPDKIRIADYRAELLQDITEEDCLAEGIIQYTVDLKGMPWVKIRYGFDGCGDTFHSAREAFAAMIDKISGRGTWDRNPWAFAYTFELVK